MLLAACTPFESKPPPETRDDASAPTPSKPVEVVVDGAAVCPLEPEVSTDNIRMKASPTRLAPNTGFEVVVEVDAPEPSTNVELLVCSTASLQVAIVQKPKVDSEQEPFRWTFQVGGQPVGTTMIRFRADPSHKVWSTLKLDIL